MAADLESLTKEGRHLFRQGKHADAIRVFEQALQIDPDQIEIHEAIAAAHFVQTTSAADCRQVQG